MIASIPLIVLVLALLFGVPIAVALAGSGMLGIWMITGDPSKVLAIVSLTPFSTVADYALTTIPMFILMAYFSASSGLARDLYQAASNWLSHIKGGSRSRPCSPAVSSAPCRARASPPLP